MVDPTSEMILSHDTILTAVANRLRRLILTQQLKPGDRLVQNDLAMQLGVSRTPIREALQQLASEGLVMISPYKGATVAEFAPEEIEAIYHVRIALESYAARLVARNITDEEIGKLRELLDAMQRVFAENNPDDLLDINREFYVTLYAATRQQRLYDMLLNHIDLSRQYRRMYFYLGHLAMNTVMEHKRIVDVFAQHDEDAASLLIRTGLEATAEGLLSALRQADMADQN
ncbi:MAG: GntR family transcriptional regulator [Anaerolineae bacterium]|nr:GntR family transcriptional regulator [Anaerolineae bacterium]